MVNTARSWVARKLRWLSWHVEPKYELEKYPAWHAYIDARTTSTGDAINYVIHTGPSGWRTH